MDLVHTLFFIFFIVLGLMVVAYIYWLTFTKSGKKYLREYGQVDYNIHKAKWINLNHNGTYECSRCGRKSPKSMYCPHCGSIMEGKIND